MQSIASGRYRPKITWSVRGGSAKITKQICSNDPNVPEDAVEEAIGRLFPKARRVKLTILSSMRDSSSHVSGLRRRSRVFLANDDSHMAACVVKLGRVEKIRNEIRNYEQYVRFNLPAMYRPEKMADTLLWDVGAVAYSYVGNNGLGTSNGPQTFFNFYRATTSTEDILMPLQHFFDASNWGVYYTFDVTMLGQSLFEAYDASWNGVLNKEFERWCTHDLTYSFPNVPAELPNATRWITDHVESCFEVEKPRQAVTHGDTRTLLLAGVLCRRLEHWQSLSWPPPTRPKVTWIAGSDTKGGRRVHGQAGRDAPA